MNEITVRYEHGDHFHVQIGTHGLVVDQPHETGGDDLGPTPTQLFVAGLAACAGFYAERYLRRHGIAPDGLAIRCSFTMSEQPPARVRSVALEADVPAGVPPDRRVALIRVMERCTVHNSIVHGPQIEVRIAAREEVA
jgi:uncharacterized OsmC-like protein